MGARGAGQTRPAPPGGTDLARAPEPLRESRHGDIDYLTIATPDSARAKAFYGAVGWGFAADGWQIEGVRPMAGLHGGQPHDVHLCFRVDDLDAALDRVREHGGEAGEPQDMPYGRLATCADDQGHRFYLLG
ncbi:hypothetical protein GCM10027271_14820 [Saccharopolyspora gloriosae]|uniref:Putative enzyme related to lactoylglutathione lyase n=1 Tax=Saccharopolyspora gloriosae TaxID=455344 RepID=A0A840N5V7_9PSEU|nr:putative enzyme related to lactoylglutathione lyase [Saccharopolyspora gloriosae]